MSCSCNDKLFYPAKVRAMVNGLERIITFQTGYKCEMSGPKSHGRHGMNMLFMIKGDKGVVQFLVYTGWLVDWKEYSSSSDFFNVQPADLGYHSYAPQYEEHTSMGKCPWLNDKECYYDGSGLQANEAFKVFVSKGEEALWDFMEKRYELMFCKTEEIEE